jgi:hypothetical protein
VITRDTRVIVDSYWGDENGRAGIKERRDHIERDRKLNTSASSHWGSRELDRWRTIAVARNEADCQVVNGMRLFSIDTVNRALNEIYGIAGFDSHERFSFPARPEERKELYQNLVGRKGRPREVR